MTTKRNIGRLIAMSGPLVATRLADSAFATGVTYAAVAYMTGDFLLLAWAGYVRRRDHWTRESWRRYTLACLIPIGALLVMVGMMFALEWRLPIVGARRSLLRTVWAAGTVIFMLVGAVGLATVVGWLSTGDAPEQFELPTWLRRRRGQAG
jgi:hypothetical protein